MIDYFFLAFIALFAALTPSESEYRSINIALAGKFMIFIGLYELFLWFGLYGGAWEDSLRMCLDISFAYLFFRVRGFYLSFLCVVMAIFHLFNAFLSFDYKIIMIGFQVLQLMAASWGVIDGLIDRVCARFYGHRTNHPRHN